MAIVWTSIITSGMVADLTDEQVAKLINCLDAVVEIVSTDFGVE